jgi:hypothetical protein
MCSDDKTATELGSPDHLHQACAFVHLGRRFCQNLDLKATQNTGGIEDADTGTKKFKTRRDQTTAARSGGRGTIELVKGRRGTPRCGVTIAAMPAAAPAISGHRSPRSRGHRR